jgi:pseudaminic acid cytidylyltransferase
MSMSSRLCIIPARGGSKRIPKKNIRNFNGKPVIIYSIEMAINSGLFDEVMVSTDSDEIAKLAVENKASVPFLRSRKNSSDNATTVEVLSEVLHEYRVRQKVFDFCMCIYPTAVLAKIEDIHFGLSYLNSLPDVYTCVFPVTKFSYPVYRALRLSDNGEATYVWPEYKNVRSQDIEELYHDAGQWYWYRLTNGDFIEGALHSVVLDPIRVQDIDNESDWNIAELKARLNY